MNDDHAHMIFRSLRLLTVATAILALALPATGLAAPRAAIDRGIVQSVAATEIVIRSLDGSVVPFTVTPRTRVRVDKTPSTLAEIRPGLVASVRADRRGRAVLIQVFGTRKTTVVDTGIVTDVERGALTIRTADDQTVTFALHRKTRFKFRGKAAPRFIVRTGALVSIAHVGDAPATVVFVLKRPGA